MRSLRVHAIGDRVVFDVRQYDGIDRPDYTEIERMSPELAEALAASILGEVAKAREAERAIVEKRAEVLKREIKAKQTELDALIVKLNSAEAA